MQKWTTPPNKRNEPRSYFYLLKNLNRYLNTNINKIHSIFCTDTFHTSDEKKSLTLIMNQHSAFSLACEWILFVSAWQNSVYIKPENTEWWLNSQFWFEENNWIFCIKCFNLSTCLPVALDQSKSTAGTSLSEGLQLLHGVEAMCVNESKIESKSWKRFGFGLVPLGYHKTSGTRKQ